MKGKPLVFGIVGLLAVSGFLLSTNYADRENIAADFKSTTDGSYFRKYLMVQEDSSNSKDDVDSSSSDVQADLQATVGQFQGLWSKADGTVISQEEFEQQCQQVYGDYWGTVKGTIGLPMDSSYTAPIEAQYDSFKNKFGDNIGLIHYYQIRAPFAGLLQNWVKGHHGQHGADCPTISSSGCGPTALSAIMATMLHKYITPGEFMAARDTWGLRMGQAANAYYGMWSSGDAGAMVQGSGLVCEFVRNQKYNGQSVLECTKENLIQARVDETLAAGGMVLLVPHDSGTGVYWTGGGHYITIRDKDEQGNYYTVDGTHDSTGRPQGNTDVPHPWSDLQNCGFTANAVHYVTPGPGYEDYIKSLSSVDNSGDGGVSQSIDTEKIISMSEEEFFAYLTDGKWKSYAEINATYASNPDEIKNYFEGNVVQIDVPAWKWSDATKTSKVDSTVSITVHKNMKQFFTDFMTDLHDLPEQYVIETIGGFQVRGKNNGTGGASVSSHSFGTTLDINPYTRGMGSVAAPNGKPDSINYPVEKQSALSEPEKSTCCTLDSSWYQLAVKYQLSWGGNWSDTYKDPMHFSLVGDGSKGGFSTTKKGTKWQ